MRWFAKPTDSPGLAVVIAAYLFLGVHCAPPYVRAQPPKAEKDGLVITVPNPITDDAVSQIRLKIQDAVERKGRNITTVVFDFNPHGQPAGSSTFGSCNDLAVFIRNLQLGQVNPLYPKIATFAFVHNEATKHTVLPILACKEIILSDDINPKTRLSKAKLGDVTRELGGIFNETMRTAYREVAKQFPSPDVIERMLDPGLPLKHIKTDEGPRFVSSKTLAELEKAGKAFVLDPIQPDYLQAQNALFEPHQAMELKLCSGLKSSKADLVQALGLPRHSMVEDWLVGRVANPIRIDVRGPLDKGKLDSLERQIGAALGQQANFILLKMDAEGGDITHVASTARFLRQLRDANDRPVKTVAYLPPGRVLGAATFLALGCMEIVMAGDAALGDFSYLGDDQLQSARDMLLPLVKEQGYPPALFEATLQRDLVLFRVKAKSNPSEVRLVSEVELKKDAASKNPQWDSFGRLERDAGKNLKIDATLAREFRIAQATGLNSLDELFTYFGLDSQRVRVASGDWLEQVADFFREPTVRFVLIMLGIIGLILEMKMPGITAPGVMAAICFVLFFWAYSFVGQYTFLAILLFILGLILIGVEVFVMPGVTFPGIAGVVLVISSLVLVTLEKWPQNSQDWIGLGTTFGTFGLSLVAAIAAALVLAWYLPHIPYVNRLVLKLPDEEEAGERAIATPLVDPSLLGAIGVAATPLRPAGKVQFGEDFLDVVAEGDYVQPGSRVQIIEIEGNRIVVKEI
ncbi:MAG: hypothetical protein L0Y72_29150 [Gemmataceae bacterium]|nr:hypothetical protein [Gemmataceae bacterium]MCI0743115.1 hypothetical protein [Gemmataceae bacterium]